MQFSRFHVGGNSAVHGGVLPLLFDSVFGMVIHAAGRPISRTGFLHVDYRKVTPIDTPLTARGWIREIDGRKAFVNAELRDPDGTLLRRGQRFDDPAAARPALTLAAPNACSSRGIAIARNLGDFARRSVTMTR